MSLSDRIEKLFMAVQKPVRYMGGEFNAVMKDPAKVNVRYAFLFPDTYEVGMSHLGMKILYHAINGMEDAWCERVFSPWVDMAELMRKENIPLFSLESRTPVKDFDLLGVTLQYEMSLPISLTHLILQAFPCGAKSARKGPLSSAAVHALSIPNRLRPLLI